MPSRLQLALNALLGKYQEAVVKFDEKYWIFQEL